MPVKDAHSFERNGHGVMDHFWTEKGSGYDVVFRLDDETDSVTLYMRGTTTDYRAPDMDVKLSVRISDADVKKMRDRLDEILRERAGATGSAEA